MDRATSFFAVLSLVYVFGVAFEAIYHTEVWIPFTQYVIGWQDALLANVLAAGMALILAWHFYDNRDIPPAGQVNA